MEVHIVREDIRLGVSLVSRFDVYETLCPQQMLVHKGGHIKNWSGECRNVTPTKLQCQNIQRPLHGMQVFYQNYKFSKSKSKKGDNSKKIK